MNIGRWPKQIDTSGLFFDEIEHISENPENERDFGFLRPGYWRTKVKSHYVLYKWTVGGEAVEIIRVLHQRMDIGNRLE